MKSTCFMAAGLSVFLHAQPAPPAARQKFDVVSIKRCQLGIARGGDSSPGRLTIGCALLADTDNTGLIQQAYNRYAAGTLTSAKVIPIEGAPDWIHSEAFQIDAKSEAHPSMLTMLGPMMQGILEDRFELKIHRETRQGPVYELSLGKGAPKLKPLQDGSCAAVFLGQPLPVLEPGQHLCKRMVSPRGSVDIEGGTLLDLASLLGMALDRPVVDKTGITGLFQIHLAFSPDDSTAAEAPGIFQAIQEQLGLKPVPAKGPMDVLVIDHVERPTRTESAVVLHCCV